MITGDLNTKKVFFWWKG